MTGVFNLNIVPYQAVYNIWLQQVVPAFYLGYKTFGNLNSALALTIFKAAAVFGYLYGTYCPLPTRKPNTSYNRICKLPGSNEKLSKESMVAVIPTYITKTQEMDTLGQAINALTQQSSINRVVIVDDASPFKLDHFEATKVSVISLDKNVGPAGARNTGISYCKQLGAEYVLLLDADCIADSLYGETMLKLLKSTTGKDNVIVAGNTQSLEVGWASTFHDLYGTLNGRYLNNNADLLYACTCNMAFKLSSELPQFDESFPTSAFEDVDFSTQVINNGGKILFEPQAIVKHKYQQGLKGVWSQFKKYGSNEINMMKKNKSFMQKFSLSKEIPTNITFNRSRLAPF